MVSDSPRVAWPLFSLGCSSCLEHSSHLLLAPSLVQLLSVTQKSWLQGTFFPTHKDPPKGTRCAFWSNRAGFISEPLAGDPLDSEHWLNVQL